MTQAFQSRDAITKANTDTDVSVGGGVFEIGASCISFGASPGRSKSYLVLPDFARPNVVALPMP